MARLYQLLHENLKHNKLFNRIIPLIIYIACWNSVAAQQGGASIDKSTQNASLLEPASLLDYPRVNYPMPYFELNDVHYFSKRKISLYDFKGKWLFLDFWFPGCVVCIKSFPKTDKFQKKFSNKAHFLLVGLNYKKFDGIVELYEKLRIKQNLTLSIAYDSSLAKKWKVYSMPHIIVIDPQGIVRYVIDGRDLTESKIDSMVNGYPVHLYPSGGYRSKNIVPQKAPMIADTSFIFRSTLSLHTTGKQIVYESVKDYNKHPNKSGFKASMVPLHWLYNYAYIGKSHWRQTDSLYKTMYPTPVLEIKDSTYFKYNFITNVGQGTFDYELQIPKEKANENYVKDIIKNDLKRAFNYDVKIETRKMPVWKLTASDSTLSLIKTKGGKPYINAPRKSTTSITLVITAAGFSLHNYSMDKLLYFLTNYLDSQGMPFIDETGITDNIDIKIDAAMSDINQVRRELKKYGMDLVRGQKEMNVVVIRDPQ